MAALHLQGRPASPGIVSGPVIVLAKRNGLVRTATGNAAQEADVLRVAIAAAIDALTTLKHAITGEAAEMIAFQIAMLEDPALSEGAFTRIAAGEPADIAWRATLDAEIEGYLASGEEYFRARAADLGDLRDRVSGHLAGGGSEGLPYGAIAIADDIAPSFFLSNDWAGSGIALRSGSPTSHVAMLARSRGIPMVVGLGDEGAIRDGQIAVVDGTEGRLILDPHADDLADMRQRRRMDREAANAIAAVARQPAVTRDGQRISVLLNISGPAELDTLDPAICDGIGLVRTELLFEGRALPNEEAQRAVYAHIAGWAAGRPVTIRTLDAGGDKPVAGLTLAGETNPFLGVRGVRLMLRHPAVFKIQLRALARAAAEGNIEIMVPMISVPGEIAAVRQLLDAACAELRAEGLPHVRPPLGIMVEVPAVAVAPERYNADFYSIGSNDLVQYTLAAGRDVAALADLASAADPAVLKLIANVVHHGRLHVRKVSLCGDAGGDPALIPALLEAGLTHLSMAPSQVGAAKLAIAQHGRGR